MLSGAEGFLPEINGVSGFEPYAEAKTTEVTFCWMLRIVVLECDDGHAEVRRYASGLN